MAFRVADTHAHALVVGTREEAGQLALFVEAGLRKGLGIPVPFERCRIRPINDERHLANTLRYLFKQRELTAVRLLTVHNLAYLARLMADLRAGATAPGIGGPAPFSKADRSRFLEALDAALMRLKRTLR